MYISRPSTQLTRTSTGKQLPMFTNEQMIRVKIVNLQSKVLKTWNYFFRYTLGVSFFPFECINKCDPVEKPDFLAMDRYSRFDLSSTTKKNNPNLLIQD